MPYIPRARDITITYTTCSLVLELLIPVAINRTRRADQGGVAHTNLEDVAGVTGVFGMGHGTAF